MKINFDWETDVVYVGFYKGHPYCISEYEDFVDNYMRTHRMCEDFTIDSYDCDSLYVINRSDIFLYEYNGLYVTERDIVMSKLFGKDFRSTVVDTINNLVNIVKIVGQLDEREKLVKELLKSAKMLTKLTGEINVMEELQRISEIDNPFIYSPMSEYRQYVSRYEEYLHNKEYWDSIK